MGFSLNSQYDPKQRIIIPLQVFKITLVPSCNAYWSRKTSGSSSTEENKTGKDFPECNVISNWKKKGTAHMEHFQNEIRDHRHMLQSVCEVFKRPQCRLNTNNLMNNHIYADVLGMLTFPS